MRLVLAFTLQPGADLCSSSTSAFAQNPPANSSENELRADLYGTTVNQGRKDQIRKVMSGVGVDCDSA